MRPGDTTGSSRAVFERLFVAGLAAAVLLAGPGFAAAERNAEIAAAQAFESRRAFEFSYEDVNPRSASFGKRLSLRQLYADGGVVLNFIASWCVPCWLEVPAFQKLHLEQSTPVVGVAADEYEGGADNLLRRVEHFELTFPVLLVPEDEIELMEQHYDHPILPTTYLIDGQGGIRKVLQGMLSEEELFREAARQPGS